MCAQPLTGEKIIALLVRQFKITDLVSLEIG